MRRRRRRRRRQHSKKGLGRDAGLAAALGQGGGWWSEAQCCRGTEEGDGVIYSPCLAERMERQGLTAQGEWDWQKEQMAIFRVTGKYFK